MHPKFVSKRVQFTYFFVKKSEQTSAQIFCVKGNFCFKRNSISFLVVSLHKKRLLLQQRLYVMMEVMKPAVMPTGTALPLEMLTRELALVVESVAEIVVAEDVVAKAVVVRDVVAG